MPTARGLCPRPRGREALISPDAISVPSTDFAPSLPTEWSAPCWSAVRGAPPSPVVTSRSREAVSKFRQPEELQAIADIEPMIARSSYVGSMPDKGGDPNIKAWHEYEAPVQIAGKAHRFTIKVRELRDGHRFYDSFSQKRGPGAKSGTTSETLGGPEAPSPAS